MKIVAISDTHQLHHFYGTHSFGQFPSGDMIIHCGDSLTQGNVQEFESFILWFKDLPYKYKILTAGNHDFFFEQNYDYVNNLCILYGIKYLIDNLVEIEGIKIYGSPWVPRFGSWAYQYDSSSEELSIWNKIPDNIDILVTHVPCKNILDGTSGGHIGSKQLEDRIKISKPKYHLFGHVHEHGGESLEKDGIIHVNCSVHTWLWKQTIVQHPFVFEL